MRALLVLFAALALPRVGAFTPAARPPALRPFAADRRVARQSSISAATKEEPPPPLPPPSSGIARPPLPQFEWSIVVFFMANPLVLLPVAALLATLFRLPWLGSQFVVSAGAALHGTLLAIPLLVASLLADRLIPALIEVTRASKCISLYAMGAKLAPLRALVAATLISTSAAVAEELAFRGVLQTGVAAAVANFAPGAAGAVAIVVQALIFGALHSYSAKCEYLATATVAGLAFGWAFASTGNIGVPIAMHFVIDVAGFLACHWQVTRAPEPEQRALLDSDAPIAQQLRAVLGARVAAQSQPAP